MKIQNKDTKSVLTFIAILIPVMLVMPAASPLQSAEATKCASPHCYAEEYTGAANSGNKYTTDVTQITPINSCTSVPTVTQWQRFSNGDWIESGFTSGHLPGNCFTNVHGYYGYTSGGGSTLYEYDLGVLSVGSVQTFEISDTNRDTYWDVYRNGGNVAHLQMISSSTYETDMGAEGNDNNPSSSYIPKTHMYNEQRFTGSPGSWNTATDGFLNISDESYGYWPTNCTPSIAHLHVITGTSASDCSGTH